LEYSENEDDKEEEEEEDYFEKKYTLITKFYNDYLDKDDNLYMKKNEAYDL
jgi:hypothetical protein